MGQQFVFFISPWSTGKTICMKAKAVMWATQNPQQKLFFVVVKKEEKATLLEMELKDFFQQQNNLQNVEVIGLRSIFGTLKRLLELATTHATGAWMVDELVMPRPDKHKDWTEELQQLQDRITALPGKPPLWIACAGVDNGEVEHCRKPYLTSVLPKDFHIPEMDVPLRNTKETLKIAGLEDNKDTKNLGAAGILIHTNPVYRIPDQLMTGVKGDVFNYTDDNDAIDKACREVLRRSGGAGFPVLCDKTNDPEIDEKRVKLVKSAVERTGATALFYLQESRSENCTEAELEEWLRGRRNGEEKRVLITDSFLTRGWEVSHALVIAHFDNQFENLVMRTVGYCALIKNLP